MTTSAPVAGRSVLVVEDDADIRRAIVQVLEDENVPVDSAENGQAALAALRRPGVTLPSVILLDLMMPVMDGWTFRAEQQRDPTLAHIPVVILTADSAAAARAGILGADGALRKPIDLEQLLMTVERYRT
jgi:CheY-like chemotaxis protein